VTLWVPVDLYGGFAGHETAREERDPSAHPTRISGDLLGDDGHPGGGKLDNSSSILVGWIGPGEHGVVVDGLQLSGSWGSAAVTVTAPRLSVEDCTIEDNRDFIYAGAVRFAGTIALPGDGLTLRRSTFRGNRGEQAGAVWASTPNPMRVAPDVVVEGCEFVGNTSSNTFINNSTRAGALAIAHTTSWVDVRCSTFVDNDLDVLGGQRLTLTGLSASPLARIDFHDNLCAHSGIAAGLHPLWFCIDPSADDSASYNRIDLVPQTWNQSTHTSADPVLMDRLGPDGIAGTGDEDVRLDEGSPCVDAGNNLAVPAGLTVDLDGRPRFADDPNAPNVGSGGTRIVDIGAYER
jgi:hypothetical protein